MGDVIHALPMAENARAFGATVGWVVERRFSGLLEGNPNVDRVFTADTREWRRRPLHPDTRRDIGRLRREIREFAPEFAIDVQGLWKSALVARAVRSPVIGFARSARREPASAAFCTIPVVPAAEHPHVVEQNLALLEPTAVEVRTRAPDAAYLTAIPAPEADAFLASVPRPFVLVHPGAGRAEKAWGEERFAHLARGLIRERGIVPIVSWGPGDERRGRAPPRASAQTFANAAPRLRGARARDPRFGALRRRRHRPAPSRRRSRCADARAFRTHRSGAQRSLPRSGSACEAATAHGAGARSVSGATLVLRARALGDAVNPRLSGASKPLPSSPLHGRQTGRSPPQAEADYAGSAGYRPEAPAGGGRQDRRGPRAGRRGVRGRHHRDSLAAVRRALDRPRALRDRSRRHQGRARRGRPQVRRPPRQQDGRDADHRDGRSHQRLRHGRHQVHDRLQRRAGRGLRDRAAQGDRQALRDAPVGRPQGTHEAVLRASPSRWRRASRT